MKRLVGAIALFAVISLGTAFLDPSAIEALVGWVEQALRTVWSWMAPGQGH